MSKTDYTKTDIESLKQSAKRSAYAQLELGYRFEVGMDIDQSYKNAEEMYKMASAKGLADATKALIELYSFDHVKYIGDIDELVLVACSQYQNAYNKNKDRKNCSFMIYELLYSYLSKPQIDAADVWLKKSINHGNLEAIGELGRRYLLGENKKQSFKRALKYYEKAWAFWEDGFVKSNLEQMVRALKYNIIRNIDTVPKDFPGFKFFN